MNIIANKRVFWLRLAIVFLVLLCIFFLWKGLLDVSKTKNVLNVQPEIAIDENIFYPVTDVSDGDTFKVKINENVATVRLLGIDTPETVDPRKSVQCFGKEASEQTKKLILDKSVRLSFETKREKRDKYGRYLAYVYRYDGIFLNEELIKGGFAREYTYGSTYSMRLLFKELEKQARLNNVGLWKMCQK